MSGRVNKLFARSGRCGIGALAAIILAALVHFVMTNPALAEEVANLSKGPAAYQPVHVDAVTGFAINGYDPVAYFIDGYPREGSRDHQQVWRGVTWLFVNAGNKAAFANNPELYAPAFGGYDALGAARGRLSEPDPTAFIIHEQALYLFFGDEQRRAFLLSPDQFVIDGQDAWYERTGQRSMHHALRMELEEEARVLAEKEALGEPAAMNPELIRPTVPDL